MAISNTQNVSRLKIAFTKRTKDFRLKLSEHLLFTATIVRFFSAHWLASESILLFIEISVLLFKKCFIICPFRYFIHSSLVFPLILIYSNYVDQLPLTNPLRALRNDRKLLHENPLQSLLPFLKLQSPPSDRQPAPPQSILFWGISSEAQPIYLHGSRFGK